VHNKPFPESGPAGGNIIVTSGNTTPITGLENGKSYTVYVTLVDANHNVLNPPVTKSVTFSVAASTASWDVNSDGEVNIIDLVIVAKNFGQKVKEGDVNGDGKVDIFDLVLVANHFGEKISLSPSISIEIAPIDYLQYLPILEKAYQLLQALSNSNSNSSSSPEFEMARKLLERLILAAKSDIVVKETKLLPNYPSPFNPETWIPFTLSEENQVEIFIYDVAGRLIRRLSLGILPPGRYSVKRRAAHWDGRNEVGELVASGIYIIELRTGKHRQVQKSFLIK
jgi:hypothetical protein